MVRGGGGNGGDYSESYLWCCKFIMSIVFLMYGCFFLIINFSDLFDV